MEPQGSKGPLIAIIIVVLILIAGGVYMMKSRTEATPGAQTQAGQTVATNEEAKSDEVSSLETEAQAGAGVDNLEANFSELDQELGN